MRTGSLRNVVVDCQCIKDSHLILRSDLDIRCLNDRIQSSVPLKSFAIREQESGDKSKKNSHATHDGPQPIATCASEVAVPPRLRSRLTFTRWATGSAHALSLNAQVLMVQRPNAPAPHARRLLRSNWRRQWQTRAAHRRPRRAGAY